MDETRTSLLADDLRKVATSGMSSSSGREQAQGLFVTRGRTNERGQGRGRKSRSKSRAPVDKACFKCGELGHFKANCPNKRVLFKKYTINENYSRGKQDLQEASYVSNGEDGCFSVSDQDHDISGRWMLDSGASHHMDVTFDEKSMVPKDGDVTISNKQVIEIESEDQPNSSRGQVENPIANEDEQEDEHDYEEVQQENTHVLQQQQQESLDTTRPKRNYKTVQKFGSDKPLRHYGQVNLVEYALSVEDDEPLNELLQIMSSFWPRFQIFNWRLILARFPMKSEMAKRGIFSRSHELVFPLCWKVDENFEHLLLTCPMNI
ncbi:hypothetical protein KIW84_012348 [Lathyrus oleraceus]|uniref:CCHC-type domain-containing protein n=1 Tax=Pisum sativum TaxID=3888 RepID=A0A9D5BHC5_PEA|nr:hypothetical protein KIW84_012348 [Pisum sativum]